MTAGGVLGMLGALIATLGAVALAARLLRRAAAGGGTRALPLRVVQRVSLSPRQGVALLQVGERVLVVGLGDHGLQLLTELDPSARETVLPAASAPRGPAAPSRAGRHAWRAWLPAAFALAALACAAPAGAQGPPSRPAPVAAPPARPADPTVASPVRPAKPFSTPVQTGVPSPPPTPAGAAARGRSPIQVDAPPAPSVELRIGDPAGGLRLEGAVGIVVLLGAMTLLPALFLLMTSFTRILIVLHFLRSALGTQTAPPSQLLAALAILLTGVVMHPVLDEAHTTALQPYLEGRITQAEAYGRALQPFRGFMLAQTRDQDLALFADLSGVPEVEREEDLPIVTVVSAFVTSELRTAFQMGFVLFLPFVVMDIVVASVLMSLGMFMLPPVMISLPLKLLLFVLADGWTLVVQNLVASFR